MGIRPAVWVVAAGLVALAACGDPQQQTQPGPQRGGAHPFAVGKVGPHHQLTIAGRGTDKQEWSAEMGADTPYVIVDVDGRTIVASVVPWEPMESSLKWASASGDLDPEQFTLDDDRPAAYGEGTDGGWDDLVIEVGPTEALRIASDNSTRDELIDLARYIDSDGDADHAPTVKDPPTGWKVLGTVEADALVAMRAEVYKSVNLVPGPKSGYSIGWLDDRPLVENTNLSSLAVMVLPGSAASLDALAARLPRYGESYAPTSLKVNGRQALLFDGTAQFGSGLRSIVTNDETGALVFVTAYGEYLPTQKELADIAGSVKPIDGPEWDRFEIEVFGGSDLVPDRGETELARGKVDGVEWLLQTSTANLPPGATGPDRDGKLVPLGPRSVRVDECLKLSNRERSCGQPSGGGENGSVYLWMPTAPTFTEVALPEYVMITTSRPEARRMRVTAGDKVTEADVHLVPDGSVDTVGAGVAFVNLPELTLFPVCIPNPPPAPAGMGVIRIDLLDATGQVIGCIGS